MIRQAETPNVSPSGWVIESGELTVENTTYCGAKCVMCPRDEFEAERKWQHMDFDLFTNVIDQGADLGMHSLDLCGFGDPFMDPNYEQKLAYVREKYPQVKIYTSTTAHLVTEKRLDWIAKYFDTLKISNYGLSQESYEAVHKGVVKYDETRQNIERLLEIPREKRPYVILSFLILPENEHETQDWIDYWEPKADEIMVWKPHNFGGAASIEDVSFRTSARETHNEQKTCGRPARGNPYVRANGDVSVCCYDFNHKLVVGQLNQKSLKDVLLDTQLAHVKDIHARGAFKDSGLLCEGCDQTFDRADALVYASNPSRKTNQPTSHSDMINKLVS